MQERRTDWHAMTASEVLSVLRVSERGLSAPEVEERSRRHGPNALPEPARPHPIRRFLAQFHSTLIYFLLAAAAAAWILGHLIDAAVIVAVVTVNAIMGFLQEDKAEKALAAIRRMISPTAAVRRDGARISVPVAELVPGDIVLVEAGDRVPADVRLLRARGLLVDEAMLTGESVAAEKQDLPAAPAAALGDRVGMLFSGTLVAAGQGTGVVVETAERTEIGGISRMMAEVETLTTPLLRQIDRFGQRFTGVAAAGAVLLFAFATLVRGYDWSDALMAVVALAVGLIPEGLPAVITITLAIGVQRMAARNAVVATTSATMAMARNR